jgi:anti-sigma factor RsiW
VPALGAALAALLAANGAILASLHPDVDRIADDVLAGHVRALVTSHPIEVASSDRHTVKPWYVGRLDFSPPVTDFATDGFPLEGGRLDYVDGRTVAALVYARREHRIDAFVWPAPEGRAETPTVEERRGFHLVHWARGGMRYWLASDLETAEMERLARLLDRAAQ